MPEYVYWFVVAILLVALEMTSGTFYILIIGIAAAGGGIAALFGLGIPLQITSAAVIGVVGTLLLHSNRAKRGIASSPEDSDLDVGQQVDIDTWKSDRRLRVFYRGTQWDAELSGPEVDADLPLVIVGKKRSILLLANHTSSSRVPKNTESTNEETT